MKIFGLQDLMANFRENICFVEIFCKTEAEIRYCREILKKFEKTEE